MTIVALMISAMLLIGPTGSGKTPFGQLLEDEGIDGRRFLHFDFGLHLRRAAEGCSPLSADETAFVRETLAANALLEDEHFPIAEKILQGFLAKHEPAGDDWLVLNGLPRHPSQARRVDAIVNVQAVAHLVCSPETVFARIRTNAGGDRDERRDDSAEEVRNKLAIFVARTEPLIDHYRLAGCDIYELPVGPATSADETRSILAQHMI